MLVYNNKKKKTPTYKQANCTNEQSDCPQATDYLTKCLTKCLANVTLNHGNAI